jgi:pimeloyl-ACP methyl ester carboxylesterase
MRCELDNLWINYETRGEGRPIVLLHGWPLDHHHMMHDLEPQFQQRHGWKRLYLDLPGMGQTPGPDWLTTQDQMLDAVLAFIDAVVPGERFVLVGTSYGGLLARGVIARRAPQVDGMLLIVPLIQTDPAKQHLPAKTVLVANPALLARLAPEEAADVAGIGVVQDEALVATLRRLGPAGRMADQAFLARLDQTPGLSFDVDDLAEPFPAPVLIVTGRQDHWCGYRDAWELLERYPRATFAVLDRGGHALGATQEELIGALTSDWLDRVEEYAATSAPAPSKP